jgi:hypothetical protein
MKGSEYFLREVRRLAKSRNELPHCQLEWASALAEFGDFEGLESIAANKALDAERRCAAAERLAELGEYVRGAGICRQIALDYSMESREWQRCGLALIAIGDVEEGVKMVPNPVQWCSAVSKFIKLGRAEQIAEIARCNDVQFDTRTHAVRALKEIFDRRGIAMVAEEPCSTPLLNLYSYWILARMGLEHAALEGMHRLAREWLPHAHSPIPMGLETKSIYERLTISLARHDSASPSVLASLIAGHYMHDLSSDVAIELCAIVFEDERSRPQEIYIALKERMSNLHFDRMLLDVAWRPRASVPDDTPLELVTDVSICAAVLGAKEFAAEHLAKVLPGLVRCASGGAGSVGASGDVSGFSEASNGEVMVPRLSSSLAGAILWCFAVGRVASGVDALLKLRNPFLERVVSSNLLDEIVKAGDSISNHDAIRELIADYQMLMSIRAAGALALVNQDQKPFNDLVQEKSFRHWVDERKWTDTALIERVEAQLDVMGAERIPPMKVKQQSRQGTTNEH